MKKLEEVYKRLQENKKKRRDLNKMYKDELGQTTRYVEISEELAKLREEKKSIENEIKSSRDYKELDELKDDIQTDGELLSDIALTMYVDKESVEIIDEYDNKWFPVFKVTFKKE